MNGKNLLDSNLSQWGMYLSYLHQVNVPLIKGKIQLQSEAAEVFYKNIQIKKLDQLPEEYAVYFK